MANMHNNETGSHIGKTAKNVAKTSLKAAKAVKKINSNAKVVSAGEKIILAIFKAIGGVFGSALGTILIVIAIVIAIFDSIPRSIFFSEKNDAVTITNNTKSVISEAYDLRKNDAIEKAVEYLNNTYSLNLNVSDYDYDSSSFVLKRKSVNYNLKLLFSSEYESSVNSINAYASAVNSTLSFYDYDEEKISADSDSETSKELEINDYINSDSDAKDKKLEEIAEDIKENGNEYETQLNDKYVKTLKNRKDKIFVLNPNVDSWNKNINYQKDVVVGYEQKMVIDSVSCKRPATLKEPKPVTETFQGYACPAGYTLMGVASSHYVDDHDKPIKEDFIDGTLTAEINYDMTFYKADELNILTYWIIESGKYGENLEYSTVYADIQENINNYYNSYFEFYGLEYSENDSSTLMGMDSIFLESGDPGWEGDFTASDYVHYYDYVTNAKNNGTNIIWNHIHSTVGGTKTQCVTFVIGWLYDAYGKDFGTSGLGNGQNVVHTLVEREGWRLLDTPAPGAIFSSGPREGNPYGHTGVILSVHGDDVVILEGNVNSNGAIRCWTTSLTTLLTKGTAGSKYVKYAVPN